MISRLGIEDLFDTVDAGRLNKGKPDPEIFLTATEQLGVPPPLCRDRSCGSGDPVHPGGRLFAVGVGSAGSLREADWILVNPCGITLAELRRRFQSQSPQKKQLRQGRVRC
ncbi:beta-phosphoglucomutase [Desmospora sp. 8437]|nr:beta-phosphoglucomutase [Desmospora sp. 8437]